MRASAFACVSTTTPGLAVGCALATLLIVSIHISNAQTIPYERSFPQSKIVVEQRIKQLQSSSAGRLPALDGFTVASDRPLNRFRRGYYQCTAEVTATPSGGSMVRVDAVITAWYADPVSEKSGYLILPSNGRLETDFLDHLQETLGGESSGATARVSNSSQPVSAPAKRNALAAKQPKPPSGSPFRLGDPLGLDHMSSLATQKAVVDRHAEEQAKEAKGLEEILRNQAHPTNLVAVKKQDTPVFANPIENAKVLFLAAAEDEFEILDMNPNWAHVRISGISRGWIRRSSLEMPAVNTEPQIAQIESRSESAPTPAQPFHVENEQIASFPGNWAPLLGKTVRIITVQKVSGDASATGPDAKRAFAKSLFDREYADVTATSSSVNGIVMIFDSEDGGMIAATVPALRQWKAGTLSDEAFWRRCFVDPSEAFGMAANP